MKREPPQKLDLALHGYCIFVHNLISIFCKTEEFQMIQGVNPAGTSGYRNGTESFFGMYKFTTNPSFG
jgi:hypothetical protein